MNIPSEQDNNNTEVNTLFPQPFIFARFVFFEEPENVDTINVSVIKKLTGGDTFYARPATEKG